MIFLWVSLGLLVFAVLLACQVLLTGEEEPRGAIALLLSAFLGVLSVAFMWLAYQ